MTVKRRGIVDLLKPSGHGATGRILPFRPRFGGAPLAVLRQPLKVYGRIGDLDVRQARTRGDVKRAQRLRYNVFYEELSAIPDALAAMSRRDEDAYDPICDHLLVVDHAAVNKARRPWARQHVVGTYRVLRQEVAELNDGFYSQGEYDVAPLIERHPDCRFMELGRSCVLAPYRNKRTVELLWQGIWTYAREHGVQVMIGCASFEGTDPRQHAMALSFLHHFARAPEKWRVKAHDEFGVDMNMMAAGDIDQRAALRALPPLIKGYLRVGARIGDGAVVDHQFGTTDVFVVLPVESIESRYFAHFGAPDEFANAATGTGTRYN
jgi:L-ornithine Nalpha-acyltransferase